MTNQKVFKPYIIFALLMFCASFIYAQEEEFFEEDDSVTNVFNYGMLVNVQTTETVRKGAFELRILHRFGELDLTDFKSSVVDEFLGFDGSANIRFGFHFGISDNFQIGIGRTKISKVFDFEGKYKLIKQKEFGGTPFSATLYFNTAVSTRSFPEVGPNEFFDDLETPFEYKFSHRFTYNMQFLVSRKFSDKFSLELNPGILVKNLVPPGESNVLFVTSLGGRFKTGLTSSIIFEFTKKFNGQTNNYTDPISLGFEIGTAGHAFQMFITSSNQIIEQGIYYSQPSDYTDGKLLLGFNLKRTFLNGNK
ncbi:MAG: hypothetical protein KJO41_02555 [Bacteroidia bacterium]|nr:hypothetical protein [Bacteroidia bacterium]MBT8277856.1 hypothetical protein [Bacteroidia bacterium]NNF86881.1 hypothetical protein [Winogradskyella sp.]NNK59061.1 hypothetical protein [Flavobacteriaceae bacterium]RZW48687.1 MAG: hypothetical protein EX263_08270 [Flavobacteriaceae bacterium]